MKIYFDTEFTGLHKDTTLISLGLISDSGEEFYVEFTDYDKSQIDNWIKENVINNCFYINGSKYNYDEYSTGMKKYSSFGTKDQKRNDLLEWLNQFETIEWISDVAHYDFVLLIDFVYKHAFNMPYGKHCSACHDINQDIARYYKISEIKAFDKSREEILKEHNITIQGKKHNSLYDAKVIKEIYKITNKK